MKKYKGYLDGRFVCEFEAYPNGSARRKFWSMILKRNRLINLDPTRLKIVEVN
ncbi:hypothetical protein [Vagococcus fluvialis]|uniref:hypothetical protein n=1 Tax=Vagococcus fluvialis TaxID=2738 RepID=UPI002B285FE6|nr:hypothetical protein QDW48_06315 [Vagococcus fluvialis]